MPPHPHPSYLILVFACFSNSWDRLQFGELFRSCLLNTRPQIFGRGKGTPPTPSTTLTPDPQPTPRLPPWGKDTDSLHLLSPIKEATHCHQEHPATRRGRTSRGSGARDPADQPLPRSSTRSREDGSLTNPEEGLEPEPRERQRTDREQLTFRLCVGFTTQTSCPAAANTRLAL